MPYIVTTKTPASLCSDAEPACQFIARRAVATLDEARGEVALPAVRSILAPPRRYTGPAWLGDEFGTRGLISAGMHPTEFCAGKYAPGFYAQLTEGSGGECYIEAEDLIAWAERPGVGLGSDAAVAALRDALALSESGGTVGPLPDGTVIEVRSVRWDYLNAFGEDPMAYLDEAGMVAAFNAAQEDSR